MTFKKRRWRQFLFTYCGIFVFGAQEIQRYTFATRNQTISILWRSWPHRFPWIFKEFFCCNPCSLIGIRFGRFSFPVSGIFGMRCLLLSRQKRLQPEWTDSFEGEFLCALLYFLRRFAVVRQRVMNYLFINDYPHNRGKQTILYVHHWAINRLFINDYPHNRRKQTIAYVHPWSINTLFINDYPHNRRKQMISYVRHWAAKKLFVNDYRLNRRKCRISRYQSLRSDIFPRRRTDREPDFTA